MFQARPAAACGTVLAEQPNGGPYRRCVPDVQGPVPAWMTQAVWAHFYEEVQAPPAQVVVLRDATVRGPGIVTLPGDIIVAESLINSHHMGSIGELRRLAPGQYAAEPGFYAGTPAPAGRHVLLKQLWDVNYGHWLIEGLPRVALLAGVADLAECRFIVSSLVGMSPEAAPMRAVVTDSLAAFGIAPARIEVTGWGAQVYPELIYPLPLTVQPWIKAPLAIRTLERLATALPASSGPDRLFVRRPAGSRRILRQQDALGVWLEARGYIGIEPGTMNFQQQVAAFGHATRIVGTLGAECANIAFAPQGARFFGLAPSEMLDDFFYDLISHKDGGYWSLHGQGEGTGMDVGFSVDLGEFERMFEGFDDGKTRV